MRKEAIQRKQKEKSLKKGAHDHDPINNNNNNNVLIIMTFTNNSIDVIIIIIMTIINKKIFSNKKAFE